MEISRPTTDELVESCLPRVHAWAQRMARQLPSSVEHDELYSDACMGVVKAASSWNPALGVPFAAYAHIRARGSMLDGLRSRRIRIRQCSLNALQEAGMDIADPRSVMAGV